MLCGVSICGGNLINKGRRVNIKDRIVLCVVMY